MENVRFSFLKYAVMAFGMLLLSGCERDKEPDTLSISPAGLSFAANDTEEQHVVVTTNVAAWTFQVSAGWVVTRKEDDGLQISVQNYNETGDPRDAEIAFVAGAADPVTLKITQSARNSLAVSPGSLSYGADETGSKTIGVSTNAPSWDATTGDSWISLSKQGATLTVTVSSSNTVSSPRTATIRVTAGNAPPVTVSVTQAERNVCTPPFGAFCESSFTTSGTRISSGSPNSWSGVITPRTTSGGLNYYAISRWGNDAAISVYCDYISGKIIIDDYSKILTEEGNDYYFSALAINQAQSTAEIAPDWEVKYNASTKTLDFGGTYNGYPVAVGLVAETSSGFSIINGYFNFKIVLSSTSSASWMTGNGITVKTEASSGVGNKENHLKQNILRIDNAPVVTFKKAPPSNK